MQDLKWSETEKKIARRAFETGLKNESMAILEQFKRLSADAQRIDDIWAIHDYLTDQRHSIDEKYDYRYSRLIFVFGRLLREKWIEDKDLEGLAEEKLQYIHRIASL